MFGISATAWVAIGTAAVGAASALASADQQRKALHTQQDALLKAQQDDAAETAAAQTNAATAANAKLAADKRARQTNLLNLGGGSQPGLGSPTGAGLALSPSSSVLGGGAPTVSAGRAVPAQPGPSAIY